MQKLINNKFLIILYCFFISFSILLFTSKCSFFYPFNDWVDANAFFTVGKSMMHGLVPYLDLFEQKGIFLYFIYGIAYLLSNTTFHGVFIIEIISWTITLYFAYKIICLFLSSKKAYFLLPIFMVLICTSTSFTHGASAEELCFPLIMLTLYYFLNYYLKANISSKSLFISGFTAGLVLLVKYTLLGFWLGFMAMLFFDLILKKEYKKAFRSCLIFLLGMSIPLIIAIVYFLINHGLKEFINVYFFTNIFSYGIKASFITRITTLIIHFIEILYKNGPLIFILIILFPLLLIKLSFPKQGKISLIITYLITIFLIFFGLKYYDYYLLPILIFTLISLIVIFKYIPEKINNKSLIIIYIISLIFSYYNANYKEMLFTPKEKLFQYEYLKYLDKNATLVNLGSLDCGLYTTSGIIPSTYYFEKQNLSYEAYPEQYKAFESYIHNKETKYIIYLSKYKLSKLTKLEPELFTNYNLIKNKRQDFEHKKRYAYLFERK